jgi:hypothetical protein
VTPPTIPEIMIELMVNDKIEIPFSNYLGKENFGPSFASRYEITPISPATPQYVERTLVNQIEWTSQTEHTQLENTKCNINIFIGKVFLVTLCEGGTTNDTKIIVTEFFRRVDDVAKRTVLPFQSDRLSYDCFSVFEMNFPANKAMKVDEVESFGVICRDTDPNSKKLLVLVYNLFLSPNQPIAQIIFN